MAVLRRVGAEVILRIEGEEDLDDEMQTKLHCTVPDKGRWNEFRQELAKVQERGDDWLWARFVVGFLVDRVDNLYQGDDDGNLTPLPLDKDSNGYVSEDCAARCGGYLLRMGTAALRIAEFSKDELKNFSSLLQNSSSNGTAEADSTKLRV